MASKSCACFLGWLSPLFPLHLPDMVVALTFVFARKVISPQPTALFTSPRIPSAINATAQGNCKDVGLSRALLYPCTCLCIPMCGMCVLWIPGSLNTLNVMLWHAELSKKKWSSACQNLEVWKIFFSPLQTFTCSVCLTSLWLSSRSTHPWSAIGTLQLVVWTSLQWAICLNTRWNWCPHLPEAINLKYDSLCS